MDKAVTRLIVQLIVSALMVVGVLWFMWRLPSRRGEAFYGVAPALALGSVWCGLAAVAISILLWWVPFPDELLSVVFLLLDPVSIGAGVSVLWIYRGYDIGSPSYVSAVEPQRSQARMGIAMGLFAVAVGYYYVMTHKTVFTPVGV